MKVDPAASQEKAYDVSQIRLEHPHAYKAWTLEEDARLIQEHQNEKTTRKLARLLKRQEGAITSRLAKLLGPAQGSQTEQGGKAGERPGETPLSNEHLREAIRQVIESRPDATLTSTDVARLLIGLGESRRVRRLELAQHPYFGRFPQLRRRDIKREIESMTLAGEISRGSRDGLPPASKRLRLGSPQENEVDPVNVNSPPTASAPRANKVCLNLTEDQAKAREAIFAWWRQKPKQVLTLGGYAGTGKTTVIAETIKSLAKRPAVAFCCFTGKATDILREKLLKAGALKPGDYCGTIHGLIYEKIGEDENDAGRTEILWRKKDSIKTDFLIVDEASMVSKEIWNDLCSYGVPILAVGDHGQLPPIGDKYNLMEKPDVRLETIHRQAQESPIVKLSLIARQDGRIPLGEYGPSAVKTQDPEAPWRMKPLEKVMFLCGRNKTRVSLNAQIRARLNIHFSEPVAGDRVICLRNARRFKVFNGMLGVINSIKVSGEHDYRARIKMDSDILFKGRICRSQFGEERTIEYEEGQGCVFDWGYALTVHKAQGSEAPRVVLFEERFSQMSDDEWRRWLYTGITRASQELIIIGN